MAGKLAWLKQRGDLKQRVVIERIVVTTKQIETLDLPRKPIEESMAAGTGGDVPLPKDSIYGSDRSDIANDTSTNKTIK